MMPGYNGRNIVTPEDMRVSYLEQIIQGKYLPPWWIDKLLACDGNVKEASKCLAVAACDLYHRPKHYVRGHLIYMFSKEIRGWNKDMGLRGLIRTYRGDKAEIFSGLDRKLLMQSYLDWESIFLLTGEFNPTRIKTELKDCAAEIERFYPYWQETIFERSRTKGLPDFDDIDIAQTHAPVINIPEINSYDGDHRSEAAAYAGRP